MNVSVAETARAPSFEERLISGSTQGYVICAKPLRFAQLPDDTVTTFAEIGPEGCYYVFEFEADARRTLEEIPPDDRLGFSHTIKVVARAGAETRCPWPKLDATGHPFATRGVLVDRSGVKTPWQRSTKLDVRDFPPNLETAPLSLRACLKRICKRI